MAEKLTRNDRARAAGVPKWLRRYCARYSKAGLDGLLACHLQNEAPMLNHGRDRAVAMQNAVLAAQGAGRREGMAPGCNPEDGFYRVGSIPTLPTND